MQSNHQELGPVDLSLLLEKIKLAYLYLEKIAVHEAALFSDSGKANLRRAQSELQKTRLLLEDTSDRGNDDAVY